MKVYRELNQAMRAGKIRGHSIREENEAGAIVAAGIIICTLILVLAVFVNLAAR